MNEDDQPFVEDKRIRRKRRDSIPDKVKVSIVALRRNGLTYQRIADKVGVSVSTVAGVCLQNTDLVIADKDTSRILEQFGCERLDVTNSKGGALSNDSAIKALVTKYATKGEYDWLPLYFTRTYQVSHLIAKQVSVQLKQLKESLASKGKKKKR